MTNVEHKACISWRRDGGAFTDHRYSRTHEWSFDGGARVKASASPNNVPEPYSDAANVDPEEALVAATSSCHMLWFLAIAAKQGLVVDSYIDEAYGILEKDRSGRQAFSRIVLCPQVAFAGRQPSDSELAALHEDAHDSCFIANSLRCEVITIPAIEGRHPKA